MRLKVTVVCALGLVLLAIAPIMQADPIRGPARAWFDQPNASSRSSLAIADPRHSWWHGASRESAIASGFVPVHVDLNGTDAFTGLLLIENLTHSGRQGNEWDWSAPGIVPVRMEFHETDPIVLVFFDKGSSGGPAVWIENSHKSFTAGNLDPVPESSIVLPLGLLIAAVLLFRKRLVAAR